MVPYVNATSSSTGNTDGEVEGQQKQKKPPERRVKKATTKATGRSFMRSRAEQATDKSEQKKPPVLSLKDAFLSPIGRISRAEALCASTVSVFATAERLATLEAAMYKQCGVTQDTVSLARFKYQKERKQFVATLHRQTQRGTEAVDQPPSQESSEIEIGTATSETAVTELWKKLTGDSSGQIYASMLRNLAKLTEPDVAI
ncbi:uncharacterized protein PITG_05783 [Phytophthora infestans T30-4]|uniref:Uncharacterized protein n=1 Tax=Phytophthora infestans (strain T30-4) TaxID=403677 RepID=D0N5P0_PHYIT|nr:uncharacterized protein PITG_05783 [Phytophthora infestans T30-4]EEY70381.1 conserved hypothetical protein [Phytophthora infestans T30-4]|eukprot:XP_002998035.1 conserved hypothetical protein [Phytophthora infestans T30-4]